MANCYLEQETLDSSDKIRMYMMLACFYSSHIKNTSVGNCGVVTHSFCFIDFLLV